MHSADYFLIGIRVHRDNLVAQPAVDEIRVPLEIRPTREAAYGTLAGGHGAEVLADRGARARAGSGEGRRTALNLQRSSPRA